MGSGELEEILESCEGGPLRATDFSIGHRGAPLHFPEHTKESYESVVRVSAGILECDINFTKDKELVCRHSQCDRYATANILATELAARA